MMLSARAEMLSKFSSKGAGSNSYSRQRKSQKARRTPFSSFRGRNTIHPDTEALGSSLFCSQTSKRNRLFIMKSLQRLPHLTANGLVIAQLLEDLAGMRDKTKPGSGLRFVRFVRAELS